jgi:hypothetical protein
MNIQKRTNVLAGAPEYHLIKEFGIIQRIPFFGYKARDKLGFNYQNEGIYEKTHNYYITAKDKITNDTWIGPEDYDE